MKISNTVLRFGQTRWTPDNKTEKGKSPWRTQQDWISFHGFGKVDPTDYRQYFHSGLTPLLNDKYEPLRPQDPVSISLYMSLYGQKCPSSMKELKQNGLFTLSVDYPERGIPKDITDERALSYASGYEIQDITSQEIALGTFDYLDHANLKDQKSTLDRAKESLFLDVLMRAAYGYTGKLDQDDANRLLHRWDTEIGRDGNKVQLPRIHRVIQHLPFIPNKAEFLQASLATQKQKLQKALFTELVTLALPARSKPQKPLFDHFTNPVPTAAS